MRQDDPDSRRREILLFTRYPRPGKVKTRLAGGLGETEAAHVHSLLAERTLATAQQAAAAAGVGLRVCYTGGTVEEMHNWLGHDVRLVRQRGKGLGRRMANAFGDAWNRGIDTCVLIGSDCPDLEAGLLTEALDLGRRHDIVLGPAADGGYYLIGLHADIAPAGTAALFADIAWGTAAPFRRTVERAAQLHLTIATLKELHDIDRPEDLVYLGDYSHPE